MNVLAPDYCRSTCRNVIVKLYQCNAVLYARRSANCAFNVHFFDMFLSLAFAMSLIHYSEKCVAKFLLCQKCFWCRVTRFCLSVDDLRISLVWVVCVHNWSYDLIGLVYSVFFAEFTKRLLQALPPLCRTYSFLKCEYFPKAHVRWQLMNQ